MSGILDRIVRRRRATASTRLGPPPEAEISSVQESARVDGAAFRNGGPPAPAHPELNGHAPVQEEPATQMSAPETLEPEVEALEAAVEAEPEAVEAGPEALEPEPEALAPPPPVVAEPFIPADSPAELAPVEYPVPFLQRGRVRRRARYLRRLREVQFRDLGGFMVELARFQRDRPDLISAKVAGALRTDQELRALERALDAEQPLREVREAGVGGACGNCGAVHGSGDRFCATCGAPLVAPVQRDEHA